MVNQKRSAKSVSRRSFIKGVGTAAAAAVMMPHVYVRADDGSKPILGEGEHKYEWNGGWAQLPEGKKYGNTHSVQFDAQGRLFVHTQNGTESVCIFDADGKFIKSWGKEYVGGAHGLQLRKEDNTEFLYLALTGQGIVVKTTLDGELVWKKTYPTECEAYKEGKGYVPTNIAFAKNGDFYVADGYGKSFVHQYNLKGDYVRSWGGGGAEPGKMSCPHGIYTDTRDGTEKLVVADRSNSRLQYFTMEGQHISFVKGEVRAPCHFDVYKDLMLCPDLQGRITLFGKDNKAVAQLGDNSDPKKRAGNGVPKDQWKDGEFIAPHGGCFDKDGNIFICEWVQPGRVTKLRKV